MGSIGRLTSLKSLSLRDTAIAQAGWSLLQTLLQLRQLDVAGCQDGDAAALAARALPALTRLSLSGTGLTNKGVEAIADHARLGRLDASSNAIGDECLRSVSSLPSLVSLKLAKTHVTDGGLQELITCNQLRELNLLDTGLTPYGCGQLEKMLPACLVLHNYTNDDDDNLEADIPF